MSEGLSGFHAGRLQRGAYGAKKRLQPFCCEDRAPLGLSAVSSAAPVQNTTRVNLKIPLKGTCHFELVHRGALDFSTDKNRFGLL